MFFTICRPMERINELAKSPIDHRGALMQLEFKMQKVCEFQVRAIYVFIETMLSIVDWSLLGLMDESWLGLGKVVV